MRISWLQYKDKKPRNIEFRGLRFYGTPSGARTRDALIKSQVLYQLS